MSEEAGAAGQHESRFGKRVSLAEGQRSGLPPRASGNDEPGAATQRRAARPFVGPGFSAVDVLYAVPC